MQDFPQSTELGPVNVKPIGFLFLLISAAVFISDTQVAVGELPEPPSAASPAEAPPNESLSLLFAGDIMAHDVVIFADQYEKIYRGIEPYLKQADLSFANFETVVDEGNPLAGYPRFNVHPSFVEAALDAGFSVFSLANNHVADHGDVSLGNTISYFESIADRVVTSGIRSAKEQKFQPVTITHGAFTIGYLAVAGFSNLKTNQVNLVDQRSTIEGDELVHAAAHFSAEYDLFIISYHGGNEYATEPAPWKVALFERLVEAGVDIVWGHHPHVLQPWTIWRGQGREALIMYSMGNLISGQTWFLDPKNPDPSRVRTGESMLLRCVLVKTKRGIDITYAFAYPIANYRHETYGMIILPFAELLRYELSESWSTFYRSRRLVVAPLLRSESSLGFVR